MLEGLKALRFLDLTENRIITIEENALSPLVLSTVRIILNKNLLTHLDGSMLKGGKKGILRIYNIAGFGADVESPTNTFNTSQYDTIDISNCGITVLRTNGMFTGAFTVKTLNMVKCKINTIESFALKDMIHLQYLNLEGNEITSLGTNITSFAGLVQLLDVNLNQNEFTEFPEFIDSYQSLLNMKINSNKLYAIREGQLAAYSSLQMLMLEKNPFINITSENWIGPDNVVLELSITFPTTTNVPDVFFLYLTKLKIVMLNEATSIPFLITSFPDAEKFVLNRFKGGPNQLTPQHLIGNSEHLIGNENETTRAANISLTTLLIDGNNQQLQYIPDKSLALFIALTNLTAIRCQMTIFPNLSTIAATIEYVDLSENAISFDTLTIDKLLGLDRLKVLKLDDCGMMDFLWEGMPSMQNLKEFHFNSMQILRNFTEYIKPPLILDEFQVAGDGSYNCTMGVCWVKNFEEEGVYPINPNTGLRNKIFPDIASPCNSQTFPNSKQKSRYYGQSWGSIAKECLCSGKWK